MVVTMRNGENPTIRMSAFFLYFSFFFLLLLLPAAFQVQSAGGKEERGVVVVVVVVVLGWGSASPASLLPLSQTGPVWSFAV